MTPWADGGSTGGRDRCGCLLLSEVWRFRRARSVVDAGAASLYPGVGRRTCAP